MSGEKNLDHAESVQDVEFAPQVTGESYTGIDLSTREKALVWKQDRRIVPLCAGIYLLCYLDRSNIGNAKILNQDTGNDLLSETHMTSYQYTVALMVFLIAYALFEVPSNYLLKKLKPSRWIGFLMLSWGATTMGLGGSHNFSQVTGIRFLLGATEAGLFPGLVYYLTFWYRNSERSMRVALILASATLAGAFGGAIAYGVGHMNEVRGLSAWRWLFIIEGAPSCASAFLVWFFLPDYPESASWLSPEEKDLAIHRLKEEGSHGAAKAMSWEEAKEILTDWRLYAHYIFIPPWAAAYVVTTVVAWSADHFNSRGLHSALFAFIGAMGFLASAVLPADAYLHRYGCLVVAASGSFACIPPLLGWLSANIRSTAGTGLAIALNVSFGAPGQIVGVWIYKSDEEKKGYPTGHWTNAALLLMVTAGCILLRLYYGWRNKGTKGGERFAY
ncbi:MFS transporter [Aspergillus costaricaensis CBS 115574]|uniref:MFS transporter n=1 Tax=Aspergillus costaricaensis CBS 115574 TaxID=1448317 RepID=A0ACD1I2U0_9EURO|nr:MFS transporter [Aspergillus costaricaensis CBS 115574]RAK84313.1 MFS transporter [Aspergillus costaricaensis CBS 115574]